MSWISVSERLPESDEYVLVYGDNGKDEPSYTSIARYYQGNWEMLSTQKDSNAVMSKDINCTMTEDEITHWMKMPDYPHHSNTKSQAKVMKINLTGFIEVDHDKNQ